MPRPGGIHYPEVIFPSPARRSVAPALLVVIATAAGLGRAEEGLESAGYQQAEKVRVLFSQKCLSCHGRDPGKLKGGYDMRTLRGLLAGGESGDPAVVPGQPQESPLVAAIRWLDGDLEMPPKENDRLKPGEIELVENWIKAGALWPDPAAGVVVQDGKWAAPDTEGRVRVRTSGGLDTDWTNRRYPREDLWAFQPPQDVSVPPGADHPIEAFLLRGIRSRKLPAAVQASPRALLRRAVYGLTGLPPAPERVAAFLADEREEAFAHLIDELLASEHYGERMAQHWLDVVRYADSDGFARDEFRPEAHTYRSYVIRSFNEDKAYDRFVREQIAGDQLKLAGQEALAYLWMGPWEQTAMSVEAVTRQLWLDDVTNSVGVTFLAQQLRCAKCHDHKFDPIPTRDYYAMQALFADTTHGGKQGKNGGTYHVGARPRQAIRILQGGALENPGEEVKPGVLSVLAGTAAHHLRVSPRGRRAALAEWIADARNPLTARVMVNRVWQMHFGRGLVATANDFGRMGADPSHPELLDWLATWFIENGWSVKKLHRLIMTSPAYQRSSTAPKPFLAKDSDPDNRLLSYFPVRRLSAEEIRDSMLAISGQLNSKVGGPSFRAEINWEVAFQPRRLMGKIAPLYEPSPLRNERNRRSIYAARLRNLGHPFMEAFNRPLSELSCDGRDETTVTPQVFTLWHGELAHEQALALADRLRRGGGAMEQLVERAFLAVYGRSPGREERTRSVRHLAEMAELHRAHELEKRPVATSVEIEDVIEKTGELVRKTYELKTLEKYEDDLRPWQVDEITRALADLCLVLFNSSEFLYVY